MAMAMFSFLALFASELQLSAAVHLRAANQQLGHLQTDPWLERIAAYTSGPHGPLTGVQLDGEVPSIFVTVISRTDGMERRALIRDMWQRASAESGNASLTYKFAVCGSNNVERKEKLMTLSLLQTRAGIPADTRPTNDDAVTLDNINETFFQDLLDEQSTYNDVMYLDCEEGYGDGALTKKVLASMIYFMEQTTSRYFMKIDDDAFLSWTRYAPFLNAKSQEKSALYMGILVGEAVPCRDPDFRWYEPYENYGEALFPKGMAGGSGYTIDRKLVQIAHETGLAHSHILWNEDRAIGVWMNLINQSGYEVDYVNLKGIDGFWAWDWQHPQDNWATWRDYKGMIVHHGLEGETIKCLAEADAENDKERRIDNCFEYEVGKYYEPLKCASLNKDTMKNDPSQKDQLQKAAAIANDATQVDS